MATPVEGTLRGGLPPGDGDYAFEVSEFLLFICLFVHTSSTLHPLYVSYPDSFP
jgi:hypothetical protein